MKRFLLMQLKLPSTESVRIQVMPKNKMVNTIKLASEVVAALPKDRWSPETTSHREGFVHTTSIEGGSEQATLQFIIRDHQTSK